MPHTQVQQERDDLYSRFTKAIREVQQKSGFKNLLLEKKLTTLADTLEKKVHRFFEVVADFIRLVVIGSATE